MVLCSSRLSSENIRSCLRSCTIDGLSKLTAFGGPFTNALPSRLRFPSSHTLLLNIRIGVSVGERGWAPAQLLASAASYWYRALIPRREVTGGPQFGGMKMMVEV